MTEVVVKPEIAVNSDDDALLLRGVLERPHRDCIISNSIRTVVKAAPQLRTEAGLA